MQTSLPNGREFQLAYAQVIGGSDFGMYCICQCYLSFEEQKQKQKQKNHVAEIKSLQSEKCKIR
jgi:hypothetical protein